MRGHGKRVYENMDEYIGEWKNNERNGSGELFFFSEKSRYCLLCLKNII